MRCTFIRLQHPHHKAARVRREDTTTTLSDSVRRRGAGGAFAAVGVLAPVAHYDVDVEMCCKAS